MNKKVIEISRKLCQTLKLKDFKSIDTFEYPEISPVLIKIMFVCMSFHEDEQLANEILVSLIPVADLDELVIIFNRITIYSDTFIRYCKEYSKIRSLKPVITKIFKKLQLNDEEAYIFTNTDDLNESSIRRLFETINTSEFKKTKGVTSKLVKKHKDLLPPLSENGYRNIRQIGKIHIFESEYRLDHPSEIIRIEYFKKTDDFLSIYEFLCFNQLISEPDHRNEIKVGLKQKLFNLRNSSEFTAYVDLMYNGLVLKMCKSKNPIRRHMGAIILRILSQYLNEAIDQQLIVDLIYDVTFEIRKEASELRSLVKTDLQTHFKRLFSHNYEEIYGACIFLSDLEPKCIFNEFSRYFHNSIRVEGGSNYENVSSFNNVSNCKSESTNYENELNCENGSNYNSESTNNEHKNKNESTDIESWKQITVDGIVVDKDYVYGLMCCLNNMKHTEPIYTQLVDQLYQEHSSFPSKYSWRILKECCIHYKLLDKNDLLMNVLLKSDHLGLIILIRDLVDVSKINIDECVENGIDEIFKKTTNARKSGGISQYFTILIKNRDNYSKVKDRLFKIIKEYERQLIDSNYYKIYDEIQLIDLNYYKVSYERSNTDSNNGKVSDERLNTDSNNGKLYDKQQLIDSNNGKLYDERSNIDSNNGKVYDKQQSIDYSNGKDEHILESTVFHVLNAFLAIFDDYSEDQLFYLRLGFFCLQQSSFAIKNCGFSLLGSLFKKILISQKTFDNFMLSFKTARQEIAMILENAIENRNVQTIYFILFIYEHSSNLSYEEMNLILKSETVGGLIYLKATDVLKRQLNIKSDVISTEKEDAQPSDDSADVDIVTFLTAILISLNSNTQIDQSVMRILNEKFKISENTSKSVSVEFLIHRIAQVVKKFNISKDVVDLLAEYAKSKYKKEYDQDLYSPEYDFSYIIELIY